MAAPPSSAPTAFANARPAGFWPRTAAWSLDAPLIAAVAAWLAWPWLAAATQAWADSADRVLQATGQAMGAAIVDGVPLPRLITTLLHDPALQQAISATHSASWSMAWPALLAFALVGAVYHLAGECSPWQASVGKRLLGLRACDRHGRRLGIGRASARYAAGALSWATLNLGHLMATTAPDHLALHDRCSGTRVVSDRVAQPAMPRWAWAWLGLLAVAGFGATVWLTNAMAATMRTALEQALF